MEKIKERIFPLIIALSALSVSASAAFYSVSGLSKLFAGASLEVIIMASSLEVAKLVIASLLYQYWDKLNNTLKVYLTIACTVLILITSMGIYGFLSAAYQETANKDGVVTQQVTALETKKGLYEQNRDNILKEKQSLAELKGTLSKGSTTQYTDKKGNLVVRSNSATIRNIETANKSDEKLSAKLDVVNDSIFSLENKILEVKMNGDAASELGPLKYLSELTGIEMNRIINWLLLVIIFVFDPLAIALVIAANFAFAQLRPKKTYPLEEQVDDMRKVVEVYDNLEEEMKEWEEASLTDLQDDIEWDEYGNPSPIIDEEPKQTGVPVLVDPKTGKFFYEEQEPEFKNLDLDGDGIVEEEELQQVFDEADINDDGIIDKEEAKKANLDPEAAEKLNKFNESLERLENVTKSFTSAEYGKKMEALEEVTKLRELLTQQFQSRKDDDTITYF
jgi:hypothetical protein